MPSTFWDVLSSSPGVPTMINRPFGSTGLEVGEIGLGMEHLGRDDPASIVDTVRTAVDGGVNFIDLTIFTPEARDRMGEALHGIRDRVLLAGHLGIGWVGGKMDEAIRDRATSGMVFDDLLRRLGTDHVELAWLSFVDTPEDYARVMSGDGLLGFARDLRQAGKARFIGLSTHNCTIGLRAVTSGAIDVLMFPVNPAMDLVPGRPGASSLRAETYRLQPGQTVGPAEDRRELYLACADRGIALVAMKPYAGGLLLSGGTISGAWTGVADVASGELTRALGISLSPVQCLSYALSQPGVSVALPGCRSPGEVRAALAYFDAAPELRDFSGIDANALWKLRRRCVYCNHCLPCPAGIEIGGLMRLLDIAEHSSSRSARSAYRALESHADSCTECGVCEERCPFGVPVAERMNRAVEVFGAP
jgi:predicted aldo/keto reductase-like oxidoreductase